MNWTDDAYSEEHGPWTDDAYGEEHGPWTDEELMIAAGNVAFARNRRKHTETEECGE